MSVAEVVREKYPSWVTVTLSVGMGVWVNVPVVRTMRSPVFKPSIWPSMVFLGAEGVQAHSPQAVRARSNGVAFMIVRFLGGEKQGWIWSTISFEEIPKVHHGVDQQDHDDKAGGVGGLVKTFRQASRDQAVHDHGDAHYGQQHSKSRFFHANKGFM